MRAVDTNVLVILLVRDDPKQTASAEKYVARGAWVPHIALVETVWVLESVYDKTRTEIGKVIAGLLDHVSLTIQDADVVSAALEDFRAAKGVQFSDCLILAVSRRAGHIPLGTFDAKLAKLAGTESL